MTLNQLVRKSLAFHRRANFAVLLGVAVGTAVLTGALLVGDSLRGSLRDRALRQLGGVDYALVSSRFFRADLAKELEPPGVTGSTHAGLMLRGSVSTEGARVNDVTILDTGTGNFLIRTEKHHTPEGLLWRPWHVFPGLQPAGVSSHNNGIRLLDAGAELPHGMATRLGVQHGDTLNIRVQKGSDIPRESLLGKRNQEDTSQSFETRFYSFCGEEAAAFNLQPGLSVAQNVYVEGSELSQNLGLLGRANSILVVGEGLDPQTLNLRLRNALTLPDWGLMLHTPQSRVDELLKRHDKNNNGKLELAEWERQIPAVIAQSADADGDKTIARDELLAYYRKHGFFTLESRSMFIEPSIERTALEVAKEMGLHAGPTFVYLANSIGDGKQSIPYSVVAALDPQLPAPLGLFVPSGSDEGVPRIAREPRPTPLPDAPGSPLADDEIVLAEWAKSRLKAKPGDEITLTYFDPNQEGQQRELTAKFRLRGFVPMTGVAADPDLTPEFPGITDKLSLKEWNPPFELTRKIGDDDEKYWADYRTTPKAYITGAAGRKLFGSRFGELTSIRLAPPAGSDIEKSAKEFGERLLKSLKPEQGGFVFENVRERALRASGGGMDFGMLFLGFSMFLIAAALLLVGLLVRLGLDRRAGEIGLLLATGYRLGAVRRLLLAEGLILSAVGGLIGLALAVGYTALMLRLLAALWPEGSVGSFLTLHVSGMSLTIGYVSAIVVSGCTIWWALRALKRVAPSALLAGVTRTDDGLTATPPKRWRRWAVIASALLAVGLIVGGVFVRDAEARAGTFFTGGMLLLIVALSLVGRWLRRPTHDSVHPGDSAAIARLGVRNAARNPTRSLLTAALLASAAFLLVAVESFRRSPERDFADKNGGSGGFSLVAETDLPVYFNPNSEDGRSDLLKTLEKVYQLDPATKKAKLAAAEKLLKETTIEPLRLKAGDDASCLNLYQPGRPRILGVPRSLIERGGFRFAGTEAKAAPERENPWRLLNVGFQDGAIPVFAEQHTVQWMLKSDLGGTIEIPDGQGQPVKVRFVGLLQDSVFQSDLLMSDANFLKLFPRQEGFSVFLLDPPAGRGENITSLFQTALDRNGITISPATERLAAYLAVENTYLTTFQVLGGFGLLLGACGLAVVLLRNVWERRGELALLRALGYRRRTLGWMVFAENAALLLLGLGAGVLSAAAAVAPHVLMGEGSVPWLRLGLLLCLVLAVGFAAGGSAVRSTVRAPLLPALRKE